MDMRANDSAWLKLKLDTLAKAGGDEPFEMPFPPRGEKKLMPSVVSAFAQIVRWRVEQLESGLEGDFSLSSEQASSPVLDAMFALKEPKTGTDGTLSWTVDVLNPRTGDDFVLGLKEITLPMGRDATAGITRPYSVWLSGEYPRALDGLCKIISLDMRVLDPAWVGMKLKKLLDFPEPLGDFMAFVPGSKKQQTFPSTISYLARLILHRYAMLGILDDDGRPKQQMGILEAPSSTKEMPLLAGAKCPECGNKTLIRKDGCDYCTACGYVGICG
jgi:ribonucleoside-diphosphate reductase alpha chain